MAADRQRIDRTEHSLNFPARKTAPPAGGVNQFISSSVISITRPAASRAHPARPHRCVHNAKSVMNHGSSTAVTARSIAGYSPAACRRMRSAYNAICSRPSDARSLFSQPLSVFGFNTHTRPHPFAITYHPGNTSTGRTATSWSVVRLEPLHHEVICILLHPALKD